MSAFHKRLFFLLIDLDHMTLQDIIRLRLRHQYLTGNGPGSPPDVVKRLLAVQAQDYLGSLWAIGQRCSNDEKSVESALSNGSIIRTWPMRGTLHYVAAEDAHWLVNYLAARGIARMQSIYKKAGLDKPILAKCGKIIVKALEREKILTRDEIYERLEKAHVATADSRGMHITGHLAINGILCFGPRRGRQQTFVLMDEWLAGTRRFTPEDAGYTLALRYFAGHGPATVNDFAWWSGLTLTESRKAITAAGQQLSVYTHRDQQYFTIDQDPAEEIKRKTTVSVQLLPAYDEFTVAYKDRTLVLPRIHHHRSGMEVLAPVIAINGSLAGTWGRTLAKEQVTLQLKPFSKLSLAHLPRIREQARKYAGFLGLDKPVLEIAG